MTQPISLKDRKVSMFVFRKKILFLTILYFSVFGTLCTSKVFAGASVPCPKTSEEWESKRDSVISRLLRPSNSSNDAFGILEELEKCGMSATSVSTASTFPQLCMKKTTEMLAEFTKPLAQDRERKYVDVPKFLQDAHLIKLINQKKVGEAMTYLKETIAKRAGIPSFVADAFQGTVASPGGIGEDRLVVRYTDENGTTRWVNFAVPGRNENKIPDNIAVIAHSKDGYSYFQDFKRTVVGNSVSISRKEGSKDCTACHMQGYNAFPYSNRMVWSGLQDDPNRRLNIEGLHSLDKGRFRPMGEDGKPLDIGKYGPRVGDGKGLEERRTNAFMESCFNDILNSKDQDDVKYRPDISKIVKEADLYEARKNRIREFMYCGECHHEKGVGALTFPFGFGERQLSSTRVHPARIYDGSMPASDFNGDLKPEDRRVLANCLFREQYGFPIQNKKPTVNDIKSGRFYEYMADIDCVTGKSKNKAAVSEVTVPATSNIHGAH